MKILCVSDQIDPLVYSNAVKERFADVDVVISAGDLPMEYIDFIVSSLNTPTFFVFGNHNLKEYPYYHHTLQSSPRAQKFTDCNLSFAHGAQYAGFKVLNENGLLIAGASGSMLYNRGLNQYTDRAMFRRLLRMVPRLLLNKLKYGRYLDIFITHTPPLDIHDKKDLCHRGFACYRWFLSTFKPAYMIHGHIHLYDIHDVRVSTFEQTTVINAFSHYILDIPEKKDTHGN